MPMAISTIPPTISAGLPKRSPIFDPPNTPTVTTRSVTMNSATTFAAITFKVVPQSERLIPTAKASMLVATAPSTIFLNPFRLWWRSSPLRASMIIEPPT